MIGWAKFCSDNSEGSTNTLSSSCSQTCQPHDRNHIEMISLDTLFAGLHASAAMEGPNVRAKIIQGKWCLFIQHVSDFALMCQTHIPG